MPYAGRFDEDVTADSSRHEFEARLTCLEASLQEVLRENTKLSSDLAACQSELVKATKELAHAADSQTAVEDLASFKNAEVERLRDRVDALQQERDELIDMVAQQAERLASLTKPIVSEESPERRRDLAFLAQSLRTELLRTRDMVARRDEQIKLMTASFVSLKRETGLQKEEFQKRAKSVSDESARKEQALAQKLASVEQRYIELQKSSQITSREVKELRNREIELESRLRDAIEVANAALQEKDLAKEAEAAALAQGEEMEAHARKYAEEVIRQADERLLSLESQWQASMTQMKAQVKALQKENEKLSREGEVSQAKVAVLEQALSVPVHEAQTLLAKARESQTNMNVLKEENESLTVANRVARDQVRALQREADRQREKLEGQVVGLKKALVETQAAAKAKADEVELMKSDVRVAKAAVLEVELARGRDVDELKRAIMNKDEELSFLRKDLETRMASTESFSCQSVVELNRLLAEQQKIAARWKQEAKHLAAKSQERISELRQEVRKVRAEKREAELRLHMQQFQVELSSKSGQLFSGNHGDLDKAFQQKLDGILKGA